MEKHQKRCDELVIKATTKIKVVCGHSDEFPVEVGVHQGLVLSSFLFATVVDVTIEEISKGLFHELAYVDDLVLTSEFYKMHSKKICKLERFIRN